jgi:hypothetical protein
MGDGLKELILRSLQTAYVARSCKDGIETGNHYQSVWLGDDRTTGFRTDRAGILDQIEFTGKRVLDLGSNLGEISRAARARGATLVDGFEYDKVFLETAHAINAYNRTTRVSFFHRDITDRAVYCERYDIVLALSVFTYVRSVLDRIADITDQILVVETHKLDGNLETDYVAPVREYFPHYRVLGQSEWGSCFDQQYKRSIIVFSKDRTTLEAALRVEGRRPAHAVQRDFQPGLGGPSSLVDVSRTCLQEQFFAVFDSATGEDLFAAVAGLEIDVQAVARLRNSALEYEGWLYWLLFLRGYLQYTQNGTIGAGNVYYEYLTTYYVQHGSDVGMRRQFASAEATIERVKQRYRDLDVFRGSRADTTVERHTVAPVRAIISDPPPRNPLRIHTTGAARPLLARRIDGWHRLFSARVSGSRTLPLEVVREEYTSDAIQGRVERLAFDGRELEIEGWLLHPGRPIQAVEVRLNGETLAIADVVDRRDVRFTYPEILHARYSGFSVRCACRHSLGQPAVFEVLGLGDWLPVGSLSAPYRPRPREDSSKTVAGSGGRAHDLESGSDAYPPQFIKG